jgi:hypothetical protein
MEASLLPFASLNCTSVLAQSQGRERKKKEKGKSEKGERL